MGLLQRTWIDVVDEIATDAATLSALLRDVDGWSDWVPGLEAISRRPGEVGVGTRFLMRLKMPGFPVLRLPSQVFIWEANRFEWGGGIPGSSIRHGMVVTDLGEGRSQLRHYEHVDGVLALLSLPFARAAYRHDRGWSDAVISRFKPVEPPRAAPHGSAAGAIRGSRVPDGRA